MTTEDQPPKPPQGQICPSHGGCWFCYRDDGEMFFDVEFDTWVHELCLRDKLTTDPEHPEAQLMSYLLK